MKKIFFLILLILTPAVFAQSAFTTGWSPKVEYKGNGVVVIVKGVSDTTDALYSSALNLNGYRAPFYRISVVGATTANDLTTFDIRLYAYRRD